MQITVKNVATSQRTTVDVPDKSTAEQAIVAAGYGTSNAKIRVNNQSRDLSTVLFANDVVSVTQMDIKGASDDDVEVPENIREKTFDDIVNAGKNDVDFGPDGSVLDKVLAQQAKDAQKVLARHVSAIVGCLRAESTSVNATIKEAEKRLADAKKNAERVQFAAKQLNDNNIWSALALLGRKDEADCICRELGCAVPPANSKKWHTHEDDAKKSE